MRKRLLIPLLVGLASCTVALSGTETDKRPPVTEGFTAGEHITIGDEIALRFDYSGAGVAGTLLHLPNGLTLTYGQIIAMGDFYGTPGKPIAYGKTRSDRHHLFMIAFSQFARSPSVAPELYRLLDVMHEERAAVANAIQHGQSVAEVYRRISEDQNRRYNCITGGGCSGEWWLNQGRYLQLAKTDYDHFGNTAFAAYHVGHMLALQQAVKAHDTHDKRQLELAYAMNAFACHFLTDRFSSGHLRTPRFKLDQVTTPAVIGSLLSHYMHDEEGESGLHVHNALGDHWVAYGDKHYFDRDSAAHRKLIHAVMQQSADEVFAAYTTGVVSADEAGKYLPIADVTGNAVGHDVAPMFYWDCARNILYRRKNLANKYDFHFTAGWWGWSTLSELVTLHGMPHG